jgi:hypothetical protein
MDKGLRECILIELSVRFKWEVSPLFICRIVGLNWRHLIQLRGPSTASMLLPSNGVSDI